MSANKKNVQNLVVSREGRHALQEEHGKKQRHGHNHNHIHTKERTGAFKFQITKSGTRRSIEGGVTLRTQPRKALFDNLAVGPSLAIHATRVVILVSAVIRMVSPLDRFEGSTIVSAASNSFGDVVQVTGDASLTLLRIPLLYDVVGDDVFVDSGKVEAEITDLASIFDLGIVPGITKRIGDGVSNQLSQFGLGGLEPIDLVGGCAHNVRTYASRVAGCAVGRVVRDNGEGEIVDWVSCVITAAGNIVADYCAAAIAGRGVQEDNKVSVDGSRREGLVSDVITKDRLERSAIREGGWCDDRDTSSTFGVERGSFQHTVFRPPIRVIRVLENVYNELIDRLGEVWYRVSGAASGSPINDTESRQRNDLSSLRVENVRGSSARSAATRHRSNVVRVRRECASLLCDAGIGDKR